MLIFVTTINTERCVPLKNSEKFGLIIKGV